MGRPSIDPELMIRMLLIGYLYGIRSETRLCEEIHLNLAYRWFCGLGLDGRVPDRSSFSKNRHGRFAGGNMLRCVFEMVVKRCDEAGLVGGEGAAVDGSTIEADANRDRRGPPAEMAERWAAEETHARAVAAYLEDLATAADPAPDEPRRKAPKYLSETDPQAAWSLKDGPGRFSYETNYLIDDRHGIIMDVEATPARLSQEIVAAKAMLTRSRGRVGFTPKTLGADKSYGTGPFLAWLVAHDVEPHVPVLDRKRQTDGKITRDAFQYDADRDRYICPQGHGMALTGIQAPTGVKQYKAPAKACQNCPIRPSCTDGRQRSVSRLIHEEVREKVQALATTEAFAETRRKRKKVEMLFAHLKRNMGLRRLRLRGLAGAAEEFLLAATAQNLRRLVKLAA
ncbi:MAG: IS1182 family transposase [Pseudomonadota bacterium]